MIYTIRAEFRKLFSVRSTYALIGFSLLMVFFYGGYVTGFKLTPLELQNTHHLSNQILNAVSFVTLFAGIASLLLLAHEYRYNTIMYTLTAARSRTQVLFAKFFVITIFMLAFGALIAVLTPLSTIVGVHLHGHTLVAQQLAYGDLAWRVLFYAWAYGMYALVIIAILRNQIAAIVFLLAVPGAIEAILSLLLKGNAKYLPFTSLSSVVSTETASRGSTLLSPSHAAYVASAYIIGGWLVAWYLFLKRDAN